MFSSMLSLLGSLRGGSSFITRSLRFRSSVSAYLSRTPSVVGSRTTWTWSGWVKRGKLGASTAIFTGGNWGGGTGPSFATGLLFNSSDQLSWYWADSNGGPRASSTSVYRDPSAWYHIVISVSSSVATISVNGSQALSYTGAGDGAINSTLQHAIGSTSTSLGNYLDGYLTDVNFIDGQALTPASFGAINSSTGVWAPSQYTGTYGTNGFYLKFADASAATAAALGKDSSPNGNNWTPNNISVTPGATYDSMIDVPVNYADGGNGRGNYAVLNPLNAGMGSTIVNANLTFQNISDANQGYVASTLGVNSGAFYFELTSSSFTGILEIGIRSQLGAVIAGYRSDGAKDSDSIISAYGASWTASDIIGCAFNATTKVATFYKNNVSQGSFSYTTSGDLYPALIVRGEGSANGHVNFGQRPFQNTTVWTTLQASGFKTLNTNNLPTPSIVNGANFMAAKTYTGTAGVQSISNAVNSVSFQPDLVWIKSRTPGATSHALFDSTRGTTNYLSSNTTTAETTLAQSLTAFNANGFSLGTDTTLVNANANSYVAWQWRESITAGLDVVSYAGTGVNRTVAHNLSVAPAMIIVKRSQTGATSNWQVRHTSIAAANSIQLNLQNQAAAAATVWNSTAPTSSVFSLGTSTDVNASGISYVAYCFAEIAGFSKFGSYTGNGSTDGPFVFCGFRPRFVMVKRTDVAASWVMFDSSRNPSNLTNLGLIPNDPAVEFTVTGTSLDILSNGIKARGAGAELNVSAATYIFAAFAEVPSKYALAR